MQFGLRCGRRRIDRGPRRSTRCLRKACLEQRHRLLDKTEDQPLGGEGATEHQRQFPGYIEQLIVSRRIVGGSHDPIIKRWKVRHGPRHIGDVMGDLAELLGHRQQQLGAEAVGSQRGRMRCGRCWRGLRLRGIGDSAQRIDDLGALLVVRKRIERPLCLIGRQHIGAVRRWDSRLRRIAGLSASRKGQQRAGKQDQPEQFVRHEGPFKYRHDSKPEPVLAFAHASCRIASFRRSPVSKVCYRGGVLLAFAASQKCRRIVERRRGPIGKIRFPNASAFFFVHSPEPERARPGATSGYCWSLTCSIQSTGLPFSAS